MRRWAPIALSLLVLTAGCGTADTPAPAAPAPASAAAATGATTTGTATTDYTAADALYRQMMPGLNLPPGVSFPAHLPESDGRYQANLGLVTAQNFWLCSWLWRYLDTAPMARASVQTADAQAAVKNLLLYNRMDAYTKALDARGQQAVDHAVKAAQSGDRQTVTSFTQSTCAGPFFSQSHAAKH
jgi:hypothetical protein